MPFSSLFDSPARQTQKTKTQTAPPPRAVRSRSIGKRKSIFHVGHSSRTHSYTGRPLTAKERLHVARQRLRKFEKKVKKEQRRTWRVLDPRPCCAVPAPAQGARRSNRPRPKDPREPAERRRAIEKRKRRKEERAKAKAKAKARRKLKQAKFREILIELKKKLGLC
ncbi:uncharacterized protein SETTUDRAFT_32275 [Exserohilum turcica Et28A]|uniref:Uncharacterized protein n=1 Tax=Exserohilum turcicum (strain 28A) TaxID=671987 RepID=R0JVP5_EXST2|nr:uncharacterized protein SETTUDRAFT_32275 [Exserohilum turcica Et28A]EOA85043.1 hypothetical protein SETTUDRAFT_32275 [Exserohilum turcica Et28A]